MTQAEQAALDRWAEVSRERVEIEAFLDWAQQNGAAWQATMPLTDLLDRFYGIDRRSLEVARRRLLEEAQAAAAIRFPAVGEGS